MGVFEPGVCVCVWGNARFGCNDFGGLRGGGGRILLIVRSLANGSSPVVVIINV